MSMIGKRSLVWMLAPAVVAAVVLAPVPSEAANKIKKIWMDAFKPSVVMSPSGSTYVQTPQNVEESAALVGAPEWRGVAAVRLPAGASIRAATYLHRAWTGQTAVTLYRVKHGQRAQTLMHATSSVAGNTITPVALAPEPGADLVVRPAYRYYLSVTVGEGSAVHGVTILHR